MKKYIEGYYCQDVKFLQALNPDNNRKMIEAFRDSYPEKLTPQEIGSKIGMDKDPNVSTYASNLKDMFIKEMGKKSFPRGKPRVGHAVQGKKPAYSYLFEDKNFAFNEKCNYNFQFAPGSVKYNPGFLEMYKKIVNKVDQENIFFLLVRFLEGLFKELSHTKENTVKQMAPQMNMDFICLDCGLNHEVRDFIRAVLVHLIDQLEMSSDFIKFLKSKDFLNDAAYGELQNIVKSNDQIVSWKTKKKLVTIRIISVTKGIGTGFGRLLAINREGNIGYGVFDNTLVGIIRPEAIVQSYPSIFDVYDGGRFYIALYGIDYVVTLDDDTSFPNSSNLDIHNIATIKNCIGTEYIDNPRFLCTIEAAVVESIQLTERLIHGHPVRAFNTRISDGTGEIDVFGHCDDKICEELRDGDIIKIIGAYIHPTLTLYEEGEFEISYVELRLSPYGSIAITEPYITYDPYYDKPFT